MAGGVIRRSKRGTTPQIVADLLRKVMGSDLDIEVNGRGLLLTTGSGQIWLDPNRSDKAAVSVNGEAAALELLRSHVHRRDGHELVV